MLVLLESMWSCLPLLGLRSWIPRQQPRKVDYANGFTTSNVAVVMVSLLGHVDDEKRAVGDLGVGDAFSKATLRSRSGGLVQG
jgi:hypothetical protein